MSVISYLDTLPNISDSNFIAPGAFLIGSVSLESDSSVFFNSVLRADINYIKIGKGTNVQDNCTFHVSDHFGVEVGDFVTIGHQVLLHACKIGSNCMIGMGSVVMDGAEVSDDSIVAAGSLITKGKKFPPKSLIMGSPAVWVRSLNEEEIQGTQLMAQKYIRIKNNYLK